MENNNEKEEVFVGEGIKSGLVVSDVSENVKEGFLSYAMSVIVSRALPDVKDGFKPVQRRIIFAMNEDGYSNDKPHVKSAKIIGNVMGKYHPHGDSSIYEALVRMAQDFSMRYPLVDGHGNFGNLDGDGAAASRYTEARLSKLAQFLVKDIKENTVDFVDNYDGTEKEPVVLPSRFPNLLVNGSAGIAVGMATEIPTHNLGEICSAIEAYAANPDISIMELMEHVKGPDFPTGGIILGRSGIKKLYETGKGKIIVRGVASIRELGNLKHEIVISEIPFQVNKSTLVNKIAKLADDKIIEGITDVKDESSYKTGINIIVELSKDAIPELVLNQLYKNTDLQNSYNGNIVALVDGAPRQLGLKDLLSGYLEFQVDIIKRRTAYRLQKALDRNHVLEALIKVSDDIENVVHLIKVSEDPVAALKEAYGFDDPQVDAILSMTLRKLSRIEGNKLLEERALIEENIKTYNHILESRENIIEVVLSELKEISKKFGDERRTRISSEEIDIDDEDLIKKEDLVIAMTTSGYIKRMSLDEFRVQNRGGKGVKGMTIHSDDAIDKIVFGNTHTDVCFFTNLGKVYRVRGYRIPEGNRLSKGIPAINFLNMEENEKVMSIISGNGYEEDKFVFFVTENGICKRTAIKEFESIRQTGKIAITLKDGDTLLAVKVTDGNSEICIAANNGKMVKFNENQIRVMGRTASGVKGINLAGGFKAVSCATSMDGDLALVVSEKGYGKMSKIEDYRETSRGAKGVKTLNVTERNGNLCSMSLVNGNEDLLVVTKNGIIIRVSLKQLKVSSRNTQGVKVINLGDKEEVLSIAVVPAAEEDTDVNLENNEGTAEILESGTQESK